MWVAMYALTFAGAAIVATRYVPRMATLIIVACVALQLVDLAPRFVAMRGYFHDRFIVAPAARETLLKSPFWAEAAKHYRTIRVAPVANMARGWEWLALYAVDHGMAINTGQFARVSFPRIAQANEAITRQLASGQLEPATLYLLWSKDAKLDYVLGPDDGIGVFDGYLVIAPGWFREPRGSIAPEYLVRGPRKGIGPVGVSGRISAVLLPFPSSWILRVSVLRPEAEQTARPRCGARRCARAPSDERLLELARERGRRCRSRRARARAATSRSSARRQSDSPARAPRRRSPRTSGGRSVTSTHLARRHHREPVADVLELAHVAGPVLRCEELRAPRRRGACASTPSSRALFCEEVAREQRDVLAPLAQRRQPQPDHVEAVEEVLAEQPLPHARLEVLVRGGDHAHVRLDRRVAADAVELAVGQHAQQARLQVRRHVADLVEEQRAALGLLEAAAAHASARR